MDNQFFFYFKYPEVKKRKIYFYGILGILFFIVLMIPSYSSEARTADGRVISSMAQIRTTAEIIFSREKSYVNINCENDDFGIQTLCDDIESTIGTKPTIYQSPNQYCAYVKLREQGAYWCVDSTLRSTKTYINPSKSGYCTGVTFLCPAREGFNPIRWYIIGVGIIMAIIIAFLWMHAFKRRKEEIIRKENWASIKEEIKSKKWFYIFTGLFYFSIILLFSSFLKTFLFFPAVILILTTLFGTTLSVLKPIRDALKNKTEMVCWESYLASLCLGIFFLIFLYDYLSWREGAREISEIITFLLSAGLAFGFSSSALIHRGKLNKIIGTVILIVFSLLLFLYLRQ